MSEAPPPTRRRGCWIGLGVSLGLGVLGLVLSGPILRALPGWLCESEAPEPADALIVLAGDHSGGRIDRAIELFAEGHVRSGPFVVSGGELYPGLTWASAMQARAVAGGIPVERCVLQDRSQTTVEDAAFTAELLPPGTQTVLLVTSDFHSARAARDFRNVLGPEVRVISVPSDSGWPDPWWKDPVAARAIATECLKRLW